MIVYFYWNGLILNIRFYFQYFFLIRKFIFAAISYFLLTRIILRPLSALSLDASRCSDQRERNITTGLFGLIFTRNCIPDLAVPVWMLKCWRMPNAPGFRDSLNG